MNKRMRILAIETSCDETAIAVVDVHEDGEDTKTFTILGSEIVSQIDIHKEYGGVFPAVAKREHAKALVPLLERVLKHINHVYSSRTIKNDEQTAAQIREILHREHDMQKDFFDVLPSLSHPGVDRIAVTSGPGLEPALWVGINFAKALGMIWDVPVIGINHMEGHILSSLFQSEGDHGTLASVHFPAVALLISGGHTELVRMDAWGQYRLLGETRDDAVGEAFDKVARLLGLPYPGGPEISRLAEHGKPGVYPLPRPMLNSGNLDFSFAGLKTAVLYLVQKLGTLTDEMKADIARAFEDAATDVLVEKTKVALEESNAQALIVGGGVSANKRIRAGLTELARETERDIFLPAPGLSTDNALMIALVAALKEEKDESQTMVANGNWKIHA